MLLGLEGATEGAWANTLEATLDGDVSADVADRFGLTVADLFNLVVVDTATGEREEHRNVSVVESPRRIDRVLEQASSFVRVRDDTSLDDLTAPPPPQTVSITVTGSNGSDIDGDQITGVDASRDEKTGIFALEDADLVNLVCIPPYTFDTDVELRSGPMQRPMPPSGAPCCWSIRRCRDG